MASAMHRQCPVRGHTSPAARGISRPRLILSQNKASRVQRIVVRSTKGSALIQQANEKYTSKDLMGALNLYEIVLKEPELTTRQKQAALYGATAVHAAFGDVELAQITLRGAIQQGLDFEAALKDPDMVDIERQASPQILIQLRRFNTNAQAALTRAKNKAPATPSRTTSSSSGSGAWGSPLNQDIGDILGTPQSDKAAIDTSVGGIVKRVAILLVALSALGAALFFLGLEYMFPKY